MGIETGRVEWSGPLDSKEAEGAQVDKKFAELERLKNAPSL